MAKSPYADLPEVLKKHLPDLFASYPNLSEEKPSSWFCWTGEKVIVNYSVVCHAHMFEGGSGWDNLITAVPNTDELGLEYLRMLIRGPFRSMSDLIRLDRVGNKYYLHCLALDKWPANVLMNFCIASRVPIEFEYLLKPWAKRCEIGFESVLAFLLTYSYGCKFGTHEQYSDRRFSMARPGHMWLDPATNWSNILHGKIENPATESFKVNPKVGWPINRIWGVCEDWKQLQNMTDDEISKFYGVPISVFDPVKPPDVVKWKKPPQQFQILNVLAGHIPFPNPEPQPQPVEHYNEPDFDDDDDLEPNFDNDFEDNDDFGDPN